MSSPPALLSVNQRFPSDPAAMLPGTLLAVGREYSVKPPELVTLATLFARASVNQRLPSGPAVIPLGPVVAVAIGYSVRTPEVVTLANWLPNATETQTQPSPAPPYIS